MKTIVALLFFFGFAAGQLSAATLNVGNSTGQFTAATLNFDIIPFGVTDSPVVLANATVANTKGEGLYIYNSGLYGMPLGGGVCGLQTGYSCTGDLSLSFSNPISNLKLRGYTASLTDGAKITAYAEDVAVGTLLITGTVNEQVDVSFKGLSGITRLDIFDRSNPVSRGIAYGDFYFDIDPPKPPGPPKPPLEALSFDKLTEGINTAKIDIGSAKITQTSGGQIYIYRTGSFDMPQNGGVCAYENGTCMGNLLVEFLNPVTELIFAGYFAKSSDAAYISLFDQDFLISRTLFSGDPAGSILFDFSDVSRLTKLVIEDASAGEFKGIAYGDFKYRTYQAPPPPPSPVPLPAPALMLLAAFSLLLGFRFFRPAC